MSRQRCFEAKGEVGVGAGANETCRIDVWLWRARFVKTRGLAAALVERGRVRLIHQGQQTRLDKPSRCIRPGDALTFVIAERLITVKVASLGQRRGPPAEARTLYGILVPETGMLTSDVSES